MLLSTGNPEYTMWNAEPGARMAARRRPYLPNNCTQYMMFPTFNAHTPMLP